MSRTLGHKKRIGLVLAQVPSYSETFFRSKIKGLQDHGYEVILFVDGSSKTDPSLPCQVKFPTIEKTNLIRSFFGFISTFLQILVRHPLRSAAHYKKDRQAGRGFLRAFKNLVLNQYILKESLDWLHFGFGTLTINKEHIASVLGAEMGVSFRGFDLYIYPLKHPHCYHYLFQQDVRYHVLSQEMKGDLMSQGVVAEQISVIPPAIDTSFFAQDLREHVFTEPIQILTVARLHWKKGLEYTLEALALLKQQGIAFHYTLIGEGDQYERLVFAVHQLDLMEEVTFLGKQSPEQVKQAYKQADIYLQYSIQEGFCNAVLEAQAMGLLCIVSNAEGLPENIIDGKTGWVVPKRQPELLSNKVKEVHAMKPVHLMAIRERAQTRVQQEFCLEDQQEQWITFFEPS